MRPRALARLDDASAAALVALALLHVRCAWAGVAMALLAAATQAIHASLPYSDVPFLGMSAIERLAIFTLTAKLGSDPDVKFRGACHGVTRGDR